MSLEAEINGWKALGKLLDEFPERIQRSIVNSVASSGANVVKKAAKKNLKQNGSYKTGDLYDSIKTKKKKGEHGVYLVYTSKAGAHAHLVEYGTGPRKLDEEKEVQINPGQWVTITHTGSMPAKPFFRPAFDENHNEVMKKMATQMAKKLQKEGEKMNQKYSSMSKSYRKKLAK